MSKMLIEVKESGEEIELMDGSRWAINPSDIPTVCTWIPTAEIKIKLIDKSSLYPYEIINMNIDVSVRAMKLT